jgi:hypothetical protein
VNWACVGTLGPRTRCCEPHQISIPTAWYNCKVCPFKRYVVRILASDSFPGWWFPTGKFQDGSLEWITTTSSPHVNPSWFPVVPQIAFPDTLHSHHHENVRHHDIFPRLRGKLQVPLFGGDFILISGHVHCIRISKVFVLFKLSLIHKNYTKKVVKAIFLLFQPLFDGARNIPPELVLSTVCNATHSLFQMTLNLHSAH